MTRLNFCFTPLDSVDFDVCAGPPRPETPPPARAAAKTEPAHPAAHPTEAKRMPVPAEG